jgi:hypothetical protein
MASISESVDTSEGEYFVIKLVGLIDMSHVHIKPEAGDNAKVYLWNHNEIFESMTEYDESILLTSDVAVDNADPVFVQASCDNGDIHLNVRTENNFLECVISALDIYIFLKHKLF